ncbi:hypothetical protein G6F31_020780 [Rhizopus arrhizus]|nr:hypothetical protein G6F31_020780 [Rhizopus arrhizus]
MARAADAPGFTAVGRQVVEAQFRLQRILRAVAVVDDGECQLAVAAPGDQRAEGVGGHLQAGCGLAVHQHVEGLVAADDGVGRGGLGRAGFLGRSVGDLHAQRGGVRIHDAHE